MSSTFTVRDYWIRRAFADRIVGCVASRNCDQPAVFQIGYKFDKRVKGVITPTVSCRSACEKHGRMFAYKKDLQVPKAKA